MMKKKLLIIPITICVLVIVYLAYDLIKPLISNPCESIFQQTTVSLKSNIEIIKAKGGIFIGKEKLQDLTEKAQTVGLTLKTCCILSQNGILSSEQFLKCKEDAEQYQNQVDHVASQVTKAQSTVQETKNRVAVEKIEYIENLLSDLKKSAEKLERYVNLPQAGKTAAKESSDEKSSGQEKGGDIEKSVGDDRINLISPKNGGRLLAATSDQWKKAIDAKNSDFTFYESNLRGIPEAVFGFQDGKMAEFDLFTVLIISKSGFNLNKFELYAGNDSPTGEFKLIGRFHTQNIKLFETPFQEFKFPPVKAKYLKVKLISSHGGGTYLISSREFQLFGNIP